MAGLAMFLGAAGCLGTRPLAVRANPDAETITIHRAGEAAPILTQEARQDFRPYLHPLIAPDGRGVLTEAAPRHHPHQTGIFWGFTNLNGRNYFSHPGKEYWRRVASDVLVAEGDVVKWSTIYDLLDEAGEPSMRETQVWSMRDDDDRYILELEWTGRALRDVRIGKHEYGGLFVRMPWRPGSGGAVANNSRESNERADGKRAVWVDVGMPVEGRDDSAHIAIFDHPFNPGYPQAWRVDRRLGVGPSPAARGDLKISRGNEMTFRHALFVYTGGFDDPKVMAAWKTYSGEKGDQVTWQLARTEARNAPSLTPDEALGKMTVAPGLEVKLFAAEPVFTQPIAFCWDDRGRLWVAENRDYESRRSGFSNSGDSRILILEDTDGDGKSDTSKVFLERVVFPSAIAHGHGGLWLGSPPNLLFVPDRDRDDRPDGGMEVRLTGWGIEDRHEVFNSFRWGPDGWLYGCQGFATRSNVGRPVDGGRVYQPGEPFPENMPVKDPQYLDGAVWRYHPIKDRFEVVAHGFSNPWGLDFGEHGEIFITGCVLPHLWHVVPGGIYRRQGGKHINPHVYADIQSIADHRHRSAHGGARTYLADAFPPQYRGRVFMANIHERALLTDILEPRGSGYIGRHGDDTLLANDPQWIGFSVETGPEGAVYILDWHDANIIGMKVEHKETGRIYRVSPQGLRGAADVDVAAKSDLELCELQWHRNEWYVRRARLALQQRAAEGRLDSRAAGHLREMLAQATTAPQRLRALWALHVTNNISADALLARLDDPEPHVRGWAARLLCEDGAPGDAVRGKFAAMAREDPSPVARLYIASALQRLPAAQRWPIVSALAGRAEDAADHNLPHLLWFAIEPLVTLDPERALSLAGGAAIPQITRFVARRAAAAEQLEVIGRAILASRHGAARLAMLEGLRDGLTAFGRSGAAAPPIWPKVQAVLREQGSDAERAVAAEIGQVFGDAEVASAQLAVLRDPQTPIDRRREIVRSFSRDAYLPALPVMLSLLDEPALRRDAVRALAAFDDAGVAGGILQRYQGWPDDARGEAILTLAARRPSAEQLLARLQAGDIPRRDINAFAARQLQEVLGAAFTTFWGRVAPLPEHKRIELARYRRLLAAAEPQEVDQLNGRSVFDRTCGLCHRLHGRGGAIGPDLTGTDRGNLDYILSEIINPSDVIPDAYRLVTIHTRDGRVLAGNVISEDERQATLRTLAGNVVVSKRDIASRDVSDVSMMPEGLLQGMPDRDIRDLVAYLSAAEDSAAAAKHSR